jgi:cupin fold WbuC family metalloprotein
MKIDNTLLDNLTAQAQASPRLRMNMDLRNSSADTSQRMLNAIEPGSVVPVHRHQKTSETVVVLRGRVVEEYYSSEGVVEASYELAAVGDARSESGMTERESGMMEVACALNIPAGQWHTLMALESGTVILEMKDGAYEPIGAEDILSM